MHDFHRRILQAVQRSAPGARAECLRQRKHTILQITWNDKVISVSTSTSPRDPDIAVRNACREICKALNVPVPIL